MRDITLYNERMRKSLYDKLFFIDKIPDGDNLVVDLGCADGTMIKMLHTMFPEYCYIGFDKNKEAIENNNRNRETGMMFTDNWEEVKGLCQDFFKRSNKILVLSSVLHEIVDKSKFYKFLNLDMFDYIVIRDMYYLHDYKINPKEITKEDFDYSKLDPRIRQYNEAFLIESRIIQSIMKNYYPENLDYELREDYFSFRLHEFISTSYSKRGFEIVYKEMYILPYWKERFKQDWGIDLNKGISTHIKLILKLK